MPGARALVLFWTAYFTYFLYLGVWGPYWTIYLVDGLGFDKDFCGALWFVLILSVVTGGLFVSRLADARRWRRSLQRALSLAAVLTSLLWLWVTSPAAALVLAAVHGFVAHTALAMLDGATVDALGTERRRFGYIRTAGTVGWGVGAVLVGVTREGRPEIVVWGMSVAMALFHLATWILPDTQPPAACYRPRLLLATALESAPLMLLLGSTFLFRAAFAPYDVFGAIFFEGAGLDDDQVALLYAIGIACETAVFAFAPRLLLRFRPLGLVILSIAITALRWWLMPSLTSPGALMALQLTHGISFGLWYAAALHLLVGIVDREVGTTGQALFTIAGSSGVGVGALLAGWSFETSGGPATFQRAAVVCGLGAILLVAGARAFVRPARVGAASEPARD